MSDRVSPVRVALLGVNCASRLPVARRWRRAVLTVCCGCTTEAVVAEKGCTPPFAAGPEDLWHRWRDQFDAVLVAGDVPPAVVASAVPGALAAGKHVLLESHATASADQFRDWKHQAREGGMSLLAASPLRARPAVIEVAAALRSGKLGSAGVLRLHDWTDQVSDAAKTLQRRRETADLTCWLLDSEPETVFACTAASDDRLKETVSTVIHLGFASQAAAVVDLVENLPRGDSYFSLSLIGSTGAAYADDHHNRQLVFGGGRARAHQTGEGDWPLLLLQQQLIDAFAGGTEVTALEEIERAVRVVRSLEKSLATGASQPVE